MWYANIDVPYFTVHYIGFHENPFSNIQMLRLYLVCWILYENYIPFSGILHPLTCQLQGR